MKWHLSALLFCLGFGTLTSCGRSSGRSGKEAPPEKEIDEGQKETGEKENPPVDSVKDQPPASAPNSITYEFQVESFSEGKIFPGSWFVDHLGTAVNTEHSLSIGFKEQNWIGENLYNYTLKGYALSVIGEIREMPIGHRLPWIRTGRDNASGDVLFIPSEELDLKKRDDMRSLSGKEIILKTDEGETVVGKFIVTADKNTGNSQLTDTVLCEKEFAQVCSISFSHTISKSETLIKGGFLVHPVKARAKLTLKNLQKAIIWELNNDK